MRLVKRKVKIRHQLCRYVISYVKFSEVVIVGMPTFTGGVCI